MQQKQTTHIDRAALVKRHNPTLTFVDMTSPLTVGNGEIAFTADITGMQSLYQDYRDAQMPLCTMAQWGWHTTPFSAKQHICPRELLVETEYDYLGRKVHYPVKCAEGNEKVYQWLRQNPHKCNLVRIGLVSLTATGYEAWKAEDITDIRQVLHMECGRLESSFRWAGTPYEVETFCAGQQDTFGFRVESEDLAVGRTAILIAFPYGNGDISGSDWEQDDRHTTELVAEKTVWKHRMDQDCFYFRIKTENSVEVHRVAPHAFLLITREEKLAFSMHCGREETVLKETLNWRQTRADAEKHWKDFWQKTGVVQLCHSKDDRALELERRIVQSQYLLAVNSSGSVPPQETGLTCNSWYGKAHLEMYFWHEAYLTLYGCTDMLVPSLDWFVEHLPQFRTNAAKNGYKGARFTKMVAEDALDSPSKIAPLLVWQQPHLIYMLYLAYRRDMDKDFLEKYYCLIEESADFMADFAVKNEAGFYELAAPLIPVQERHQPEVTYNPVFEVEYWAAGLKMAVECAKVLGRKVPEQWVDVAEHMIPALQREGVYLAHSNCPETFEKVATDHPSMLMAYGVIDSGRMEPQVMKNTLEKVLDLWEEKSLWGWDFAVMSMTAVRLGNPELAIDLLLKDSLKNKYVASGNNRQVSRADLPLYLPGNGSLLLAVAFMTAGYDGCAVDTPGFPKNGMWTVEYEGISALP